MFLINENDDDVYFQKTIGMYVLDVCMGRPVKTYTPQSMRYFVARATCRVFLKNLKIIFINFKKGKNS
jgi:hypothetical protein